MSKETDDLAKQCQAAVPGAEEALAEYLLGVLPRWIAMSFSQLTPQDIEDLTSLLAVHIGWIHVRGRPSR